MTPHILGRQLLSVGLAAALVYGCSASDPQSAPADTTATADDASTASDASTAEPGDALGDGGATEPGDTGTEAPDAGGCAGQAPFCAPGCGGDVLLGPAICQGGEWVCTEGVNSSDCPADTCWGAPLPGESCQGGAWVCAPSQEVWDLCLPQICVDCKGFEEPVTQGDCSCGCEDGMVRCQSTPPPLACAPAGTSNLPDVSITFDNADCTFTLAEAAAGLSIPYQVVVKSGVGGVLPVPQDAGGCDQPGPSGLILFERLSGDQQSYCICDTGLCMGPSDQPVTLTPGTSAHSFEWDGRNWSGPSDTGFAKGEPFPAGSYTLTVSAKGSADMPGGQSPFEVVGTLTIQLVE